MAWSPKAADSREAGYIYANRYVSEATLRLQKRSGPYISLRDVLQHQVVQTQVRNQTLQLGVLLLKLLQPLRLVHLQPTVLLAPAEVRLLHDPSFLTRQSRRLAVRDRDLDLPQQIYHLLRLVLLASSHMLSLSSPLLSTGTFQAGHSSMEIRSWKLRPLSGTFATNFRSITVPTVASVVLIRE